jgi:hypothetical protein
LRNSCLLRDTYDKGIYLLNALVLGALNACVNINEKLNENKNRKKNRAHLRLGGKTVCRKMFIFAYAFTIKRYDLLRMRLNNHGVDLVFHGKISNQFNS